MEYIVKAGDMLLGRTKSYDQAVEWAKQHDNMCQNGKFARIIEKGA